MMKTDDGQDHYQYERIADAIEYIHKNFKNQPALDEIAASVHLSPIHFQKQFKAWAGVSPKKFLQYISLEYAKNILASKKSEAAAEAVYDTGFSSPSRLHDLFVQLEGMTPAEYKNQGRNLSIHYSFSATPFGEVIIASTGKGICHMAFEQDRHLARRQLVQAFPQAEFIEQLDALQQSALSIFSASNSLPEIKLHLKATAFQLKVWESLLKIPLGQLSSYGEIAAEIGQPKAGRAVGSAIGSNPVAFLIPCHRVIRSTGIIGGYKWGAPRKTAIIGWEGAKAHEPA